MDAMEILGSLLGSKSQSGGLGGAILKEILGGAQRPAPDAREAPAPRPAPRPTPAPRSSDSTGPSRRREPGVESLEELLREAHGHHTRRSSAPSAQRREPPRQRTTRQETTSDCNDDALLLIRAMISASKSDGRIDRAEEQAILGQFGDVSAAESQFLQQEFSRSVDVRELAWDVPLGQEQQVYAISLVAIDLDANSEAHYLHELAHGLRLEPQVCNQIHDRFRAPRIFE